MPGREGGANPRGGAKTTNANQGNQNYKYQQKAGNPGGQSAKTGEGGVKYQPKGQRKDSGAEEGLGGGQYQQKSGQNNNYKGGYQNKGNKPYQKYDGDGQEGKGGFGGMGGKGGQGNNYNKNKNMGGKGYNNNKNYMQGGMKQDANQFFPHQANLQQMDQSELQELLMTVITNYGPEIANATGAQGQGGAANLQALLSGLGSMSGGGGGGYGQNKGNYQNRNNQFRNQNQGNAANVGPNDAMNNLLAGMGMQNQGVQLGANPFNPNVGANSSMPPPVPISGEESKTQNDGEEIPVIDTDSASTTNMMQQQQQMMNSNLCEKHFPEPIIYMSDKPMCKKCVPEYLQSKNKAKKTQNNGQSEMLAKMLGFSNFGTAQLYQSEKNLIEKTLLHLDDFRGDFRFLNEEISERAQESADNLENLPELMCQIFGQCEKGLSESRNNFMNEIDDIITKQTASFKKDNETKVPNFYERLSQKYSQLQQATSFADQTPNEELIEILDQYNNIFMDLDAEFEKYFNEFENASKLQRLMDKDQNEIVKGFTSLIETNLRVDYNVKNSFQPGVPSRVHSFQWNQKFAYIFKVHNAEFEKRPVQMEFEVPLYSRSIATEDGGIYLIGGCNKRRNQYLKKCYRYNEIFANLDEKASMIYPHADHSLCAIEGFIYVVGTFVNSQVYGFCEVYDIQKDQWKQIDSLRVARSGVALSAFKNNYIFAFGGRVDQKNIVDTIECYDISKNVWQEIQSPQIDKSAWIAGYMSLAYQITDNEILIFGGKSALTFLIFNGCFVFDVEKMEIREKGKLVNPCSFMNTPLVFGGNLYAFGNDIYIHKYKIAEQQWVCIPKAFP